MNGLQHIRDSLPGLLFILGLIIAWPGYGRQEYPGIQHFTPENGLPSSEVYDILQDREGYIWISTDHGVCRFDGYEFQRFGKKEGLEDPVVLYLHEDQRGWIWMATYQGHFYIYKNGVIEPYQFESRIRAALSDKPPRTIINFYVNKEGALHAFYPSLGIVKVDAKGTLSMEGVDNDYQWMIWEDDGEIRYYHHLSYYKANQYGGASEVLKVKLIRRPDDPRDNPVSNDDLYWANTGRPTYYQNNFIQQKTEEILFQQGDTLFLIDYATLQVVDKVFHPYGIISYYLESKHSDRVYIGHLSKGQGLYIYPNKKALLEGNTMEKPIHLFEGKNISHILEDQQGGLWVSTSANGVYYISQPDLFFSTIADSRLKAITGLALYSADSCFATVKGREVFTIGKQLAVEELPLNSDRFIYAPKLFYDSLQQRLYKSGRISYWEGDSWNFIGFDKSKYKSWYEKTDNITTYDIRPSLSDPDRLFFFGNHYFFSAITTKNGFQFDENPVVLQPRQRPFCIHHNQRGELYVGAMQGLYLFDEPAQQFVPKQQHPALQGRIQAIGELPDSTLVIGTRFEGIVLVKGTQARHISDSAGLSGAFIRAIHVDENGVIWAGTNSGLNRILVHSMDSIEISTLGIADGLPSNEITAIASRDGQLWVATMNGLVKFPRQQPAPNEPVIPSIKRVFVNGVRSSLDDLNHLSWTENNLRIEVVSLDFPQKGRINYRYRFSDSKDWQTINSPVINLANLAYGRYQFEIQAQGSNEAWSESTIMNFRINEPFWRSLAFQLGILLMIMGSTIWWFYRRQRQRELQFRQEEHLRQLSQQVDRLRQQAYQAQMNPHFIFNCLTAIQSFMLQEGNDRLVASDYLTKFSRLIRQALNASRSNLISLGEDIKMLDNYIQLEQFRFHYKFDYEITVDPSLDQYNQMVPPMLVQPYAENAIIHGFADLDKKGQLIISYKNRGEIMEVTVEDNGTGIYQTQREKARHKNGNASDHSSMGMEISRQRLLMQAANTNFGGVKIEEVVVDGKIEGTKIMIEIPNSY